jgi:hypothetical protein
MCFASSCSHYDDINLEDSSWVTGKMNSIKLFTILGFGSVVEAFRFYPSTTKSFSNPKSSVVQKMSAKATQEVRKNV